MDCNTLNLRLSTFTGLRGDTATLWNPSCLHVPFKHPEAYLGAAQGENEAVVQMASMGERTDRNQRKWEEVREVMVSEKIHWGLKYENRDSNANGPPATVIKDSVSDAMIVWKEGASDSNPWENVAYNDSLFMETMAAAPSLFRPEEEQGRCWRGKEKKTATSCLFQHF